MKPPRGVGFLSINLRDTCKTLAFYQAHLRALPNPHTQAHAYTHTHTHTHTHTYTYTCPHIQKIYAETQITITLTVLCVFFCRVASILLNCTTASLLLLSASVSSFPSSSSEGEEEEFLLIFALRPSLLLLL